MNIYLKIWLDKNFGDDLMLYEMVDFFSSTGYIFYIHCNEKFQKFYNDLLKKFANIKLIDCPLREIRKYGRGFFKCVVLLGGSTLMGNRYTGCYYRFLNCRLFDKLRKEGTFYAIIGCNTGPFKNCFTEFFVKEELRKARLITVRDKASFDYVKKHIEGSDCRYFPDILFGISKTCLPNSKRQLGISVFSGEHERTVSFLTQLCDEYISYTDNRIKLLCFDVGSKSDLATAEAIHKSVSRKDKVEIVSHSSDCNYLIESISECDRVLAIRFHSAIIASVLNIPFLPFSYSNKMHNFLCDVYETDKDFPIAKVSSSSVPDFLQQLLNDPIIPKPNWGDGNIGHFTALKEILEKSQE
ncbi:MAG: polysaccharide pyruvyl transferase family protein [Synergistaceae bacterium]|nr:polysaccharide pyruvyl transferase family protein [Synergistaceae bacterium]